MAHDTNNGRAQPLTASDFNERVKRVFAGKADPAVKPVKEGAKRWTGGRAKPEASTAIDPKVVA